MKLNFHSPMLRVVPLAVILVIALTCSVKNPTDDLKLIINFDPLNTQVAVDFVNTKSNETIDDPITLKVEGEDKALVVDLNNNVTNVFDVDEGLVSFGIKRGVEPTPDSPVKFQLIAEAEGYLTTSINVTLDSTGGHPYTLFMVEKANPPNGVMFKENNSGSADNQGRVNSDIQVETDPDQVGGASADVVIPQGTIITDENGAPLTGNLKVEIGYFSNLSDEALRSFPGGFSVRIASNEEGSPEEAAFITAGFLSLEVTDENGREAENFSTPITITMEVPPETNNPETGQPIKAGDQIKIWSYDSETGEWTYEGIGTVAGPKANGNFEVTWQVTHLSYWNLDWKWRICIWSVKIRIEGWTSCAGCMWIEIRPRGYSFYWGLWECQDWMKFYLAPDGLPVDIIAYDRFHRRIGSVYVQNLCISGEIVLTVNFEDAVFRKRTFHVVGYCPDKRLEIRPTVPVWFKPVGTARWRYAGFIRNGVLEICNFTVPERYTFMTYYRGRYYQATFDFSADFTIFIPEASVNISATRIEGDHIYYNVDLPASICNKL